ncbi:MAG TPA: WG repeat-containing protein [Polyangia bacterium]
MGFDPVTLCDSRALERLALVAATCCLCACRQPSRPPAPQPAAASAAPVLSAPTTRPATLPAASRYAEPSPTAPDPDWLFPIGSDLGCGFIDVRGNEIIPREHVPAKRVCLETGFRRDGRFPVSAGGKVGYIDGHGQLVIPAVYDSGEYFMEGRAFVTGGFCGFLDRDGRQVLRCGCRDVEGFTEGLCAAQPSDEPP